MRDTSLGLVALSNPFDRPLHQLFLELAVLVCTVLVFGYALRAYRRGDKRPMFQWLVLTSYGVQMELIAFHFLKNYEHARFTVQLADGQLPLYVTGLYGTFMMAGIQVAERLRAHPIVECFVAGFVMCLIDVPFDIAGISVGWWRWLDTDPNIAFRWLGVPVTSYYWYLIFGAVATGLCRLAWPRLEKRSFALSAVLAPVLGFAVIFFGVLGFLPFHAVHAFGVEEGTIVAAHLIVMTLLVLSQRGERTPIDPLLAASSWIVPAVCALLLVVWAAQGELEDVTARVGASLASLGGLVAISVGLPLRRAAQTPAASVVAIEGGE